MYCFGLKLVPKFKGENASETFFGQNGVFVKSIPDGGRRVDGEPLVRVHDHAEESGVGLQRF
jgi:hypothetical protein